MLSNGYRTSLTGFTQEFTRKRIPEIVLSIKVQDDFAGFTYPQ